MDTLTKKQRSFLMSQIKSKDTSPEVFLRKLLHRYGYRFRLHGKDLPGKPDIVLKKYNAVIFMDGCFWHGHSECCLYRPPRTRKNYWHSKIEGNIERDKQVNKKLIALGWRILHVWECAIYSRCRISEERIIAGIEKFLHGNGKLKNIRGKKDK